MKKNVFIIAYAYPPNNVAGAQRPYALAKYLDKSKYNVKVITCENPDLPLGKNEDFNPQIEGVELIYIKSRLGSSTQKLRSDAKVKASFVTKIKSILYKLGQLLIFPDKGMFWFPNVKSYIDENKELIKQTDIIFSTSPGITNHRIARLLKRKNPNANWIADFRDFNYVNHWDKKNEIRSYFHKKLESSIIHEASSVTYVTETMLDLNKKHYPQFANKMFAIYNGFDVDHSKSVDLTKTVLKSKITFFYAGTFYNGIRSPFPLLQLLDKMIGEDLLKSDEFEIQIAGNIDLDTIERMKSYSAYGSIHFLGNLPRADVLNRMSESSFLWLIVGNISSHYQTVPIKLFEYIAARRPIINFAPSQSESSRIIDALKLGYNFDTSVFKVEDCYQQFMDTISKAKLGNFVNPLPKENLTSFSWANQVKLIEKLF